MNKNTFTAKFIAAIGILVAVEIILYFLGSYISIGGININLALVPIGIGAILFGPIAGLFLGFVNSILTLLTPFTQSYFMNTEIFGEWCILGTFLIVIVKTSLAGLICGFVYKVFQKKNILAIALSSLLIPVINTGVFVLGASIFYSYDFEAIFKVVISFNFLIEFGSMALLTPAIVRIIQYAR